ncbi:KR and/or adh short domain containing protein [Asbolus verrucosus]|uniref:KR and/or adh short domain containing protein n=1 Tax=Asbolus verrucosus TaxID=1661398 RepID=A0A482WBK8_ASBVE|nr:KR and/or adh short domain containing protein [Asbolus verrucosus]
MVLENSSENKFKAVEILDAVPNFCCPWINEIVENVPFVNPELTILTETTIEEIPGIKVENLILKPESNLLLIIGTKILQRFNFIRILDALNPSGFVLRGSGRLLEIGKYDLAMDNSLNLLLMKEEISYHGITWVTLNLYLEMNKVEAAFRYMTTRKHVGKILVNIQKEEKQSVFKTSEVLFSSVARYLLFSCEPEKSYIIFGGLGGVGMELADWLMLRGAEKLILVTSSGLKTGYHTQRIK